MEKQKKSGPKKSAKAARPAQAAPETAKTAARAKAAKALADDHVRMMKERAADLEKETAKAAAPEAPAAAPQPAEADDAKTGKKSKAEKSGKPEVPPVPDKPAHEIALQPADKDGVFHAVVHGKRAVVCFHERNRADAANRFASVTLRAHRIDAAKAQAKTDSLPLLMGVQVKVSDKWDSGWLVTPALYGKFKTGDSDFSLTGAARAAYAADSDSLVAVRFSVAKESKKAA